MTKGYDPLEEVKTVAAERWVAAVNAEGSFGEWRYAIVHEIGTIPGVLGAVSSRSSPGGHRAPAGSSA